MSNAITIQYDDTAVLERLQKLSAAASEAQMRTVFMEIGEDLTESTKLRFGTSTGPDGKRWAPLKPGTVLAALSKMRGGRSGRMGNRKALVDTGTLAHGIYFRLVQNGVEIGTNRFAGEWNGGAAVHQFGSRNRRIPARPFLGLSADDKVTVLGILHRHFLEAAMT